MFSENLYLTNETGKRLYNRYAKDLPIIDYHCHLIAKEIYEDKTFSDLGEIWLAHDHYKWRAMRTFGIDERLITGDASFYEKFMAFAEIVPKLLGNPMYIWCALELKRYFGIDEALCAENADEIYKKTKEIIEKNQMSPKKLIEKSSVEMICTTEDPIDSLEYHKLLQEDTSFKTKVISAIRPDKAFCPERETFTCYISQLEKVCKTKIESFTGLIDALEKRLVFFKEMGSMLSDAGLDNFVWEDYSIEEPEAIFQKGINGKNLTEKEINKYKSAFSVALGKLYFKHGFVMQLHAGGYRNVNTAMFERLGADAGYDCADDKISVRSIGSLLDALSKTNSLPKTILYPLNINQYETFAILAAAFCEGGTKGKVQLGASWWFNDQAYGINKQFESVSNLYSVALSVGMLTDSRSFLSYPRHELYRRVLCNYLGQIVERGEYFSGEQYLKEIVQDICYYNAKKWFCE